MIVPSDECVLLDLGLSVYVLRETGSQGVVLSGGPADWEGREVYLPYNSPSVVIHEGDRILLLARIEDVMGWEGESETEEGHAPGR